MAAGLFHNTNYGTLYFKIS